MNFSRFIMTFLFLGPIVCMGCSKTSSSTTAQEMLLRREPADMKAVYSKCTTIAEGKAVKSAEQILYLGKTKDAYLASFLYATQNCTGYLTKTQADAIFKEANPGEATSGDIYDLFMNGLEDGFVYNGTYDSTALTVDVENGNGSQYLSYKISGTKLTLTVACAEDDIGNVSACTKVTGDSATNRATDFNNSVVLTRK